MQSEPESRGDGPERPAGQATDEALMERVRAHGDTQAFEQLVHRYERELFNYLVRYLRDSGLAEEAFQTTFLRVFDKAESFSADRRFRPWLYAIATRQAVDLWRREDRRRTVSLDKSHAAEGYDDVDLRSLLTDDEAEPSVQLEQHEWRDWTQRAIDQLADPLRQVVLLVFFQGLKYREVAETLDLPIGTVKSRMHKALLELNAAWKRDHPVARSRRDEP